jgi:hypothetical protein
MHQSKEPRAMHEVLCFLTRSFLQTRSREETLTCGRGSSRRRFQAYETTHACFD